MIQQMPKMPGVQKKDLYMAKSIGELNKFADLQSKQISTNNPKLLLRSAEKMMKEAEAQDLLGDEERAYVLYMKYFNVITIIKKTADYRKQKDYYDSLIGKKNILKAITKAEELSSNIKDRYDLMEAKLVADKLALLDNANGNSKKVEDIISEDVDVVKTKDDITTDTKKDDEGSSQLPKSAGEITPTKLHELLNDKGVEIVIMDVRTADQYKLSHIKHSCCINVPADIVPAGTTITYIEKALPEESKSLWKQRGNLDHIVLLDWNSTQDNVTIGTTLRTLKDALFKYDSTVIIKSEPLILEGGYDQWLLYYPQLTTNANFERPSFDNTASPIPSLDFDYPDFDEAFILTPTPKAIQSGNDSEIDQSDSTKNLYGPMNGSVTSIPKIDRTNKPKPSTQKPSNDLTLNSSDSLKLSLYPSVNTVKTINNVSVIDIKPGDSHMTKNMSSSASLSQYSNDIEKEKEELERIRKQKEEELLNFQKEKERISREHQARIAKLRKEESKMEMLDKLRQEQTKDVAELMRMKKRLQEEIQQEIKKNEDEEREKELEENRRKKELRIVAEKERQRQDEVERLRIERRMKEEKDKQEELEMIDRDRADREALEKARERVRIEEETRKRELKLAEETAEQLRHEELKQKEEEKRKIEQANLEEQKRKQKELEQRKKQEQEYKKQQEMELKKQQEAEQKRLQELEQKRQQEFRERQERERQEAERKEKERKEKEEADKLRAEQAQKEAEEKLRRINGTYTAKLKDEPSTETKKGLSRSYSSPNIAKLLEEEENERLKKTQKTTPSFDRSSKPESRSGRALTGLRNLGNTCYMNSIIQESELGCHGEVAEEFAVVVKALWSGSYRCISPRDFKWMVGKHQPMFAGHDQQDSQEFLTFLLDGLHESLNKVKTRPQIPEQDNDNIPDFTASDIAWKHHKMLNESIIVELFQGQLKSTLVCLTCGKQSVTFQAFMYLSLPIPSGSRCSLQDCLKQFLKEEKMTGSSRWRCPRCKKDRDSVKKIDIWRLPRLLLIGLNRFVYEGQWRQKINSYVDFSVKGLDLNPYIIGPKNRQISYNLYGISVNRMSLFITKIGVILMRKSSFTPKIIHRHKI
ncbi:hypothetical protein KUTeg_010907 [Tegillarca granosa]|uniref:ubiquitinyl hydrolase 1 n=1 Tax=Tegillarca granosa TaxID=220873 RepID=A0ABQ9F5J4_TEGGR|nr:hypothetical protein KUTeg_010907 [Tegillarca granosa]